MIHPVMRVICTALVLLAVTGCAKSKPPEWKAVEAPTEISGTYTNAPSWGWPPNVTLWHLLSPQGQDTISPPIGDRADDQVRISASCDGKIRGELIRDGSTVEQRWLSFDAFDESSFLRRDSAGLIPLKDFAYVLWLFGQNRREIGLDNSNDGERRLRVSDWNNAVLCVVIWPIEGAGGGPADCWTFDAANASEAGSGNRAPAEERGASTSNR
jgi:hypothetical protein